ncbi:MAG: hypothetical protein LC632_00185 [Xanthomonadaceae bacterium]|nr:hypothetical protein [Xanthomonadaceae bacterium]
MSDAKPVFLLDHGRHTSLALTTDARTVVRYSYGDRRWYALGDTGLRSGFNALFRDTPAVLMRVELQAAPTLDAVVRAVGIEVERAYVLMAPTQRVDALAGKLESLYRTGAGDPDARFAPHPTPYTLGYNSNHAIADWLGELGCDVRGSRLTTDWRLAD